MEKSFSVSLGLALVGLTLAGFVLKQGQLLRLMNIDTTHSILRMPLIALLLYGGSTGAPGRTTQKILIGVGAFYIAMGAAGLADKRVGGLLPSGLTHFDIAYHFAVGAGALWLGMQGGSKVQTVTHPSV